MLFSQEGSHTKTVLAGQKRKKNPGKSFLFVEFLGDFTAQSRVGWSERGSLVRNFLSPQRQDELLDFLGLSSSSFCWVCSLLLCPRTYIPLTPFPPFLLPLFGRIAFFPTLLYHTSPSSSFVIKAFFTQSAKSIHQLCAATWNILAFLLVLLNMHAFFFLCCAFHLRPHDN